MDLPAGDVMVVLFCKTGRERNEPMIVNQAKSFPTSFPGSLIFPMRDPGNEVESFPSNYTNRVGHLLTVLLQSIVNICLK